MKLTGSTRDAAAGWYDTYDTIVPSMILSSGEEDFCCISFFQHDENEDVRKRTVTFKHSTPVSEFAVLFDRDCEFRIQVSNARYNSHLFVQFIWQHRHNSHVNNLNILRPLETINLKYDDGARQALAIQSDVGRKTMVAEVKRAMEHCLAAGFSEDVAEYYKGALLIVNVTNLDGEQPLRSSKDGSRPMWRVGTNFKRYVEKSPRCMKFGRNVQQEGFSNTKSDGVAENSCLKFGRNVQQKGFSNHLRFGQNTKPDGVAENSFFKFGRNIQREGERNLFSAVPSQNGPNRLRFGQNTQSDGRPSRTVQREGFPNYFGFGQNTQQDVISEDGCRASNDYDCWQNEMIDQSTVGHIVPGWKTEYVEEKLITKDVVVDIEHIVRTKVALNVNRNLNFFKKFETSASNNAVLANVAPEKKLLECIEPADECVVCLSTKPDQTLLVCTHTVMCSNCYKRWSDTCPVCRSKITAAVPYVDLNVA
jgi:hypothetical protein